MRNHLDHLRRLVLALTCSAVAAAPLAAQQPDSAPALQRTLERIDRRATLRFVAQGRRPLTGGITRLTADSVYVQGFDWPVALPLPKVDSVWEHVGKNDAAVHHGFAVGGVLGVLVGGWLGYGLCGLSERVDRSCGLAAVGGAVGVGVFFGSIGAVIAGAASARPIWELRWP